MNRRKLDELMVRIISIGIVVGLSTAIYLVVIR